MANPTLTTQQVHAPSHATQVQDPTDELAAEQNQLEDRRASSMFASTSQAAAGPAAVFSAHATFPTAGRHSKDNSKDKSAKKPSHLQPANSITQPNTDLPHHPTLNSTPQHAAAAVQVQAQTGDDASQLQQSTDAVKVLGEDPSVNLAQQVSSAAAAATSLVNNTLPAEGSDSSLHEGAQNHNPNSSDSTDNVQQTTLHTVPHHASLTHQPDDLSQLSASDTLSVMDTSRSELPDLEASFAESAAAAEAGDSKVDFEAGGQRSEEWLALRQSRLTASTFANALG